jgi:DNA-binding NarL/FixJ family response regulator
MRHIITFCKKSTAKQIELIISKTKGYDFLKNFDNYIDTVGYIKNNTADYLFIDDSKTIDTNDLRDLNKFFFKSNIISIIKSEKSGLFKQSLDLKIRGIVLETKLETDISDAILHSNDNKSFFSSDIHSSIVEHLTQNGIYKKQNNILTKREEEILKLILKELTNHEIADRLFLSPRTIDSHRRNLLQKTNSRNTVGLIKFAYKNGFA